MSQYKGVTVDLCNHIRHCEGFSGTGYAEQRLHSVTAQDSLRQFFDCLRLVPRRFVGGMKDKFVRAAHLLFEFLLLG